MKKLAALLAALAYKIDPSLRPQPVPSGGGGAGPRKGE
jgi:hypothetical protein